jgi:hypothetical protein
VSWPPLSSFTSASRQLRLRNNETTVTVDQSLTLVNITLGNADICACTAGDANHDSQIAIHEIGEQRAEWMRGRITLPIPCN